MTNPHAITPDQVARTARLARLRLTPHEARALAADLAAILDHASQLDELDLAAVEPLFHPLTATPPLDDDAPAAPLPRETLLAMAPRVDPPYVAVPKVIDPAADS